MTGLLACLYLIAAVEKAPANFSDHFAIYDTRMGSPSRPIEKPDIPLQFVDPALLLISAERIHDALAWVLGMEAPHGRRLSLYLYTSAPRRHHLAVVSGLHVGGWVHRLDVPDQVNARRFVRAVTQLILTDYATRRHPGKTPELPAWLIEGLSAHIEAVSPEVLVPPAVPSGFVLRAHRIIEGSNPLEAARNRLRGSPVVDFEDLKRAPGEEADPKQFEVFRDWAHLLVWELMQLPGGAARLMQFAESTAYCWNWETAFLATYPETFESLLDVEKWWALKSASFVLKSREGIPVPLALGRLDEVLSIPAVLRIETNALPAKTRVTIQEVITEWDRQEQEPALEAVLARLAMLRPGAPPALYRIIDDYTRTIAEYLQRREPSNPRAIAPPPRVRAEQTIRRLSSLDLVRQDMQQLEPQMWAGSVRDEDGP